MVIWMAYSDFAYYYDLLNYDADYDMVCGYVLDTLRAQGISEGIVADLGCGTGEVTLRLASAGYDMLAIDSSPDMLSCLSEKLIERKMGSGVQLLCQPLELLDLYGTIHAAVSTFDTLNHLQLKDVEKVIQRVSLFMETGGVLIFDMNTLYKHTQVLASNTFWSEAENDTENREKIICEWENSLNNTDNSIDIFVSVSQNDKELFSDSFTEYYHPADIIQKLLEKYGFRISKICDGEDLGLLRDDSQRILYAAVKQEYLVPS